MSAQSAVVNNCSSDMDDSGIMHCPRGWCFMGNGSNHGKSDAKGLRCQYLRLVEHSPGCNRLLFVWVFCFFVLHAAAHRPTNQKDVCSWTLQYWVIISGSRGMFIFFFSPFPKFRELNSTIPRLSSSWHFLLLFESVRQPPTTVDYLTWPPPFDSLYFFYFFSKSAMLEPLGRQTLIFTTENIGSSKKGRWNMNVLQHLWLLRV